jgi:GT2 family glycosyltransferase
MVTVWHILRYLGRKFSPSGLIRFRFRLGHSTHHSNSPVEPSVSIIIPTRDKVELLSTCIESVVSKTEYSNYNITVVDNGSKLSSTKKYLSELDQRGIRIVDYPHPFNYSKICNLGASVSDSDLLCFLNNDVEILSDGWLSAMVSHLNEPGVSLVGSKLMYPNGSYQHLGIVNGFRGVASHLAPKYLGSEEDVDFMEKECFEVSAVTFASALVSRKWFETLGGLNENLRVGLNDVDFCRRIRERGQAIVVCSWSLMKHVESATRPSYFSPRGFIQAAWDVVYYLHTHRNSDLFFDYFFERYTKE